MSRLTDKEWNNVFRTAHSLLLRLAAKVDRIDAYIKPEDLQDRLDDYLELKDELDHMTFEIINAVESEITFHGRNF